MVMKLDEKKTLLFGLSLTLAITIFGGKKSNYTSLFTHEITLSL